ncbi:hypothetical protein KR009_010451 [Drosophila setifemur]|nr:hypothetical protein KR009_010451 [Drosophila setifemur]
MKFAGTVIAIFAIHLYLMVGQGQATGNFLKEPCGMVTSRIKARIVGGRAAEITSTPWMAMITSNGEFICGASLITNRRQSILSLSFYIVRLGEYDTRTERDCKNWHCKAAAQDFDVDATLIHHDYTLERHDIALLRMATRVQFTQDISPICLLLDPAQRNLGEVVHKFNVFGWGRTASGEKSHILQKATLFNTPRSRCSSQFGLPVDQDHICADRAKVSTCNGDSGGPLLAWVIYKGQNVWIQFGIISYGHRICHNATVFTNVMSHVEWIQNIVHSKVNVS